MKVKHQMEIIFETYETTVIRFGQNETRRCEFCGTETPHLSLDQAVSVLSLSAEKIRLLAKKGQIHSITATEERLLLCGHSLAAIKSNIKENYKL